MPPELIANESELDDVLTHPSPRLCEAVARLRSPLVVLGAGGKMGPSLCVLAKRAADEIGQRLDVVAVSRFSNPSARDWLETRGVRTLSADLLDRSSFADLPDCENLVYLVGMKFGTSTNPSLTWAINALVPEFCLERYRQARIVALSTGNVYPLVDVASRGSRESDPLIPLGEYANAAVARERVFEYGSRLRGTSVVQLRLSYAIDLRYGVLHDLATKVFRGEPIPLETGHFICLWQGDANEMILRSFPLASAPPSAFNVSGPRIYSIRDTATRLGELLGREPVLTGLESGQAFVSDCSALLERLGPPDIDFETMLRWTAHWVANGGRSLQLPTHFETRDGAY